MLKKSLLIILLISSSAVFADNNDQSQLIAQLQQTDIKFNQQISALTNIATNCEKINSQKKYYRLYMFAHGNNLGVTTTDFSDYHACVKVGEQFVAMTDKYYSPNYMCAEIY